LVAMGVAFLEGNETSINLSEPRAKAKKG